MTIELYVFPPSPRAFKVMALANHLGLDAAVKPLDLLKGEHKDARLRRPQSQHADADPEGGRFRPVGIERHPAISREQAAGQRTVAAGRERRGST